MKKLHSLAANGDLISCVIYARVSTAKQADENISIDVQLEECRKYAATQGWNIVAEYIDPGASARTDKKRPQFNAMIERALEPGAAFKAILVYDHSRFYRNVGQSEITRFQLGLNGVQVQSVTQPIEDDGLTGSLAITIQAAVDENQSRMTSVKVRSGLIANARAGFFNGGNVPFGYCLEAREKRGTKIKNVLVLDEIESPIVEKMFKMSEQGEGITSIVKKLHEEGIRNRRGKPWYKSSIARILTSSTYAGRHMFKPTNRRTGKHLGRTEWVEIPCPPIVTESIFQNVQRLLKERAPNVTAPRTTTSSVLLGKVATCGSCGSRLMITTGTSRNGTVHHYYKCAAKYTKGHCPGGNAITIPRNVLDDTVITKVVEEILTPARVQEVVSRAAAMQADNRGNASARITQLKRQLVSIKRKESNLWELATEVGVKAKQGFVDRLDELHNESDGIERQIEAQQQVLAKAIEPLSEKEAARKASVMRDLLLNAEIEKKRRFISAVVDKVVVNEDEILIYGPESTLAETANDIDIRVASPVRGFDREWCRLQDSNL